MKHYGLWNKKASHWMRTGDGVIIWSSSRAVIEAYLEEGENPNIEIKEFIDKKEELKQQRR